MCIKFDQIKCQNREKFIFFTPGKPLVQKSANLMLSGSILKTVQKSTIYIFVNK